jgi:hypothetical protein
MKGLDIEDKQTKKLSGTKFKIKDEEEETETV